MPVRAQASGYVEESPHAGVGTEEAFVVIEAQDSDSASRTSSPKRMAREAGLPVVKGGDKTPQQESFISTQSSSIESNEFDVPREKVPEKAKKSICEQRCPKLVEKKDDKSSVGIGIQGEGTGTWGNTDGSPAIQSSPERKKTRLEEEMPSSSESRLPSFPTNSPSLPTPTPPLESNTGDSPKLKRSVDTNAADTSPGSSVAKVTGLSPSPRPPVQSALLAVTNASSPSERTAHNRNAKPSDGSKAASQDAEKTDCIPPKESEPDIVEKVDLMGEQQPTEIHSTSQPHYTTSFHQGGTKRMRKHPDTTPGLVSASREDETGHRAPRAAASDSERDDRLSGRISSSNRAECNSDRSSSDIDETEGKAWSVANNAGRDEFYGFASEGEEEAAAEFSDWSSDDFEGEKKGGDQRFKKEKETVKALKTAYTGPLLGSDLSHAYKLLLEKTENLPDSASISLPRGEEDSLMTDDKVGNESSSLTPVSSSINDSFSAQSEEKIGLISNVKSGAKRPVEEGEGDTDSVFHSPSPQATTPIEKTPERASAMERLGFHPKSYSQPPLQQPQTRDASSKARSQPDRGSLSAQSYRDDRRSGGGGDESPLRDDSPRRKDGSSVDGEDEAGDDTSWQALSRKLKKRLQVTRKEADLSECLTLPAPRDNELEWILEDFEDALSGDSNRYWSPPKQCNSFWFRLLVFPKGNQRYMGSGGDLSVYMAVNPGPVFATGSPAVWAMHRSEYQILAVSWQNWKAGSLMRWEPFAFTSSDNDRGWEQLVPKSKLVVGDMLGPNKQVVLRAQFCPRPADAGGPYALPRREIGFLGIKNQGATCYLNSLVQALFHIGAFRESVWKLTIEKDKKFVEELGPEYKEVQETPAYLDLSDDEPEDESLTGGGSLMLKELDEDEIRASFDDSSSKGGGKSTPEVSLALQNLFLKLALSNDVANTDELIRSFGWESNESFTQHDAQELNRLLCDRLEEQMKGTPSEGAIERLFMGEFENYVECIDVKYSSSRREQFYDLQLDVQGMGNMYESLNKYTEEEILEGDNAYDAEAFGKQRAKRGVRFLRFPPVIQFHLKRFTFDPTRMDMVKVNERFEYPEVLNLNCVQEGAGVYRLFCVIVHAGDVGGGHYYVLCRPRGGPYWIRFDDEKVSAVSPNAAFSDSYGGPEPSCAVYTASSKDNSSHKISFSQAMRMHSAYILFYVKIDASEQILADPDPSAANPFLLNRVRWETRQRRRKMRIRRIIEHNVILRLVTENSLCGFTGFFTDIHTLPAWQEITVPRTTSMYDVWEKITKNLHREVWKDPLLSSMSREYHQGLWFFDGPAASPTSGLINDLRPSACLITQRGEKRGSTVYEHMGLLDKALRVRWRPTLTLLVHPLLQQKSQSILSVSELSKAISDARLVLCKAFNPSEGDPTSQNVYFAGIAAAPQDRWVSNTMATQMIEQFVTVASDLPAPFCADQEICDYIDKCQKKDLAGVDARRALLEHVYTEEQGFFHHLAGVADIVDQISNSRRDRDEMTLILVFSLPPSKSLLKRRAAALAYGMNENRGIYEKEEDAEGEGEAQHVGNAGVEGERKETESSTEESGVTEDNRINVGTPDPHPKLYCSDGSQKWIASRFKSYPPKVPRFLSCKPVDWYYAMTRSKLTVVAKLYDPMGALGRWEDCSWWPVPDLLRKGAGSGVGTILDMSAALMLGREKSSESTPALTQMSLNNDENKTNTGVSNSMEAVSLDSPSLMLNVPPPPPSAEDQGGPPTPATSTEGPLRCPPVTEAVIEVDLRWPYRLGLQKIAWQLGTNASSCLVMTEAPMTRDADFHTALSAPGSSSSRLISDEDKAEGRLNELHTILAKRQGRAKHRPVTSAPDEIYCSQVVYHLVALPRPVHDPAMNMLPLRDTNYGEESKRRSSSSTANNSRYVGVRVFNGRAQSVGAVLCEVDLHETPTVATFIEQVKSRITPCMELRGALKEWNYRLAWVGGTRSSSARAEAFVGSCMNWYSPASTQPQQYALHPNRYEILDDEALTARLALAFTKKFQLDPQFRIEPDARTEAEEIEHANCVAAEPSVGGSSISTAPLSQSVEEDARVVTVLHQNKDGLHFGHPFSVIVKKDDTMRQIKAKIQRKLGISDAQFNRWKFFVHDYEHSSFVKDGEIKETCLCYSLILDEVPTFLASACLLAVHKNPYARESRTRMLQIHIK